MIYGSQTCFPLFVPNVWSHLSVKTGRPRFPFSQGRASACLAIFGSFTSPCVAAGPGADLQRERLEVAARRLRLLCPSAAGLRGPCIINGATRTGDSFDMQAWPRKHCYFGLLHSKALLSFPFVFFLNSIFLTHVFSLIFTFSPSVIPHHTSSLSCSLSLIYSPCLSSSLLSLSPLSLSHSISMSTSPFVYVYGLPV